MTGSRSNGAFVKADGAFVKADGAFDGSLMVAAEMRDQFNGLDSKLSAGLSGTAQNPSMSTLNIPLSDPPTRPEVQQIIDAFNTLLNQITRV